MIRDADLRDLPILTLSLLHGTCTWKDDENAQRGTCGDIIIIISSKVYKYFYAVWYIVNWKSGFDHGLIIINYTLSIIKKLRC